MPDRAPLLPIRLPHLQRYSTIHPSPKLPTAQDAFAEAVKTDLAPALRAIGFKGSGRVFRLPSNSHLLALGIQSSAYNDSSKVRFTINAAAAHRSTWTAGQDHDRTSDRFFNPNVWQPRGKTVRIGQLLTGEDRWWRIEAGGSTVHVMDEVVTAVTTHVLPWLREQEQAPNTTS